jgi:hypothetical protein
VKIPRLPKNGRHLRTTRDERTQIVVIVGALPFAARTAKCGNARVLPRMRAGSREKFDVLCIASWPATFDIVHAKCIELVGDAQFICDREADAFSLRAITQRGVKQRNEPIRHDAIPPVHVGCFSYDKIEYSTDRKQKKATDPLYGSNNTNLLLNASTQTSTFCAIARNILVKRIDGSKYEKIFARARVVQYCKKRGRAL